MSSITRENHFVPRRTTRRWSQDGVNVNVCRLLVPDERTPIWRRRPIKSFGRLMDLYTEFNGEREDDAFERQLTHDYEEPGQQAIENVLAGGRLAPADWHRVIVFFALQAMRTPKALMEFMKRAERHVPDSLEHSVRKAEAMLQSMGKLEHAPRGRNGAAAHFKDTLRVSIEKRADSVGAIVRAHVKSPRSLWTAMMRQVIERGAAKVLRSYRWSIAEAFGDQEWPLSDSPVLCLNFNSTSEYDFGGGWGRKNTDLIMPISPKKMLFVEVGKKMPNRFTFDRDQTTFMQRVLAENAYRMLVMRTQADWPIVCRPRVVDAEVFEEEEAQWEGWTAFQTSQEETFCGVAGGTPHAGVEPIKAGGNRHAPLE